MDQNKGKEFVDKYKLKEEIETKEKEMELRALQLSDKLKYLQKHVAALKALFSSNQEKLNTVKNAAENAMSIINDKCEDAKTDVDSEIVLQLQNELKTLKESTDTYSSTIAMFQGRIDELNSQFAAIGISVKEESVEASPVEDTPVCSKFFCYR